NSCHSILKNIALLYAFFISGILLIVAHEVGQFILAQVGQIILASKLQRLLSAENRQECENNNYKKRDTMNQEKLQLRPAGIGIVVVAVGDGLPIMRRLVEAFTGRDNKRYIKLDNQITPLLPSHMFISGN
ncbi:MAG: hypothetical protein K9K37_00595, partial [Desulfocapsa sp.]|nr:hypothetical protein [Desulfocapsa sp.]